MILLGSVSHYRFFFLCVFNFISTQSSLRAHRISACNWQKIPTETFLRPDTRQSRVNAESGLCEQLGVILSWCTDTDEGEADSQQLSIYSMQPRDADTLQRLLTSSCEVCTLDVMVKLRRAL